jgi:dihydrolipoamide dehydrogenase
MLVGARIEGLTETADAVTVTYRGPGAATRTLTVDVVLQAIGFAPNTNGSRGWAWRPTPVAASSSTTS